MNTQNHFGALSRKERKMLKLKELEFRFRCMLHNRLKNKFYKVKLFGYKINFLSPHFFQYNLKEVFIEEEYYVPLNTKAPVIVDCGANIGLATLYFKKVFPEADILAIEAHPETFNVLEKNVSDNRLKNIKVLNAAVVGTDTKVIELFSDEKGGDLRTTVEKDLFNNEKSNLVSVKVKAIKLSTVLPEVVDLLKMDIEGSEIEVLKEIKDFFPKIKKIILEYHRIPGKNSMTLGEVLCFLEQAGYSCIVKNSTGVPISVFSDRPSANVVYAFRPQ